MKGKSIARMMEAFVAGTVLIFVAMSNAYALDPAQSKHPDKSNIAITGRLTTPDGRGIPGIQVSVKPSMSMAMSGIVGIPQGCYAGENANASETVTDSNGSYTIVIYLNSHDSCRAAFDSITVDKSKFSFFKDGTPNVGLEIKPK